MPLYEYEIPEAGQRIVLMRPIDRRDEPVHVRRVEVPDEIAIAGVSTSAKAPGDFDSGIREGLARYGESIRDYTPDQIQHALETPPTP